MSRAWKGGSTSRWRKIREAVLKRDGCCQMCGQSEGQMHIDHVIPKRLGGGDEIWNLRQLCHSSCIVQTTHALLILHLS